MKAFEAAKRLNELNERKAAERHPAVRAVLDMIPGSEVVAVRTSQPPRPTVRTPDFDSGNGGSNPPEAANVE